ncbi:MAG: DinB family protein [Chitinophagaceae bacterium]|nr:MAG: DinB family protein [Chitinophagaceae bacterium]
MQLQQAVNNVFVQLAETLKQLSQQEYAQPCSTLFQNTIGQHVRHIIELFQCLENGYDEGVINYEKRKRDSVIENDKEFATKLLNEVYLKLDRADKDLTLEAIYDDLSDQPISIRTNYSREIAYNLEHTIHHMALIRVGINEVSNINLPTNFGVASSTVKHRNQCAQ